MFEKGIAEEVGVELISTEFLGSFMDSSSLDLGMNIKMDVYMVKVRGTPKASSEINLKLGSIVEKFIIPKLKSNGAIN